MKKILELKAIAAGLLIGIGGIVYLACENKYVGALLFCVALYGICSQKLLLFTGKVGYATSRSDILPLLKILFNNFLGTLFPAAYIYARPELLSAAQSMTAAKIGNIWLQATAGAFFCGILMYLAVDTYAKTNSPAAILLCIPTFILSGFEHSIADMVYVIAGIGAVNWYSAIIFIVLVAAYNAFGSLLIKYLMTRTLDFLPRS